MLGFKGFDKGLKCRGYKFSAKKVNRTDKAHCVQCGFHYATDPLDVLTYYPNMDISEYWVVEGKGDIHENGSDSKACCTELKLIGKLDTYNFLLYVLAYMQKFPHAENKLIDGKFDNKWFKICRGKNPTLSGGKGQWLAFAKESPKSGKIKEIALFKVDGKKIKEGTVYNCSGEAVG